MKRLAQTREQAIHLRKSESLSIDELASRLGVSRGTVYYWVKNMPLMQPPGKAKPRSEKQEANRRAAVAAMQAKYAAVRQSAYDEVYGKAHEMLRDSTIRDFVVLYLAEGYRKDRNTVALGNSNPKIVRFAHDCMKRLATNSHFDYRFQYHADQDPEELKRYWAMILNVEPSTIIPVPKTNSGHLKHRRFNCEYGVCTVRIGDTRFRAQLQALMDAVQEQWSEGDVQSGRPADAARL
jgi:AcrR family transcriptional regulator